MGANDRNEFEQMTLFAHKFLAEVPIQSLYRLDLPGGRSGMTILDIKESVGFNTEQLEAGVVTKSLFWLRGLIGRILGWDEADDLAANLHGSGRADAEMDNLPGLK